jgi:predicted ribosome quality control (RQC) complex YloA/Tae2 family protein
MPQDAFTLKYVTKELKELFIGGKISKINMPERDELSLIIYTKRGTVKLEISTSAKNNRISLGIDEKPNPDVAPNFCMLLRKHLQNAEITDVNQIDGERIVYFDFKCFSEFAITNMRLYCEIMGKYSNLILVENDIIVGAEKTTSLETGANRVLFTGAKYVLPKSQGKANPSSQEEIEKVFENFITGGDVASFICSNIAGIAYTTAQDLVAIFGENLTASDVYEYINGGTLNPCVTYLNGEPNDFKAKYSGNDGKNFSSLLEAQTEYYSYVYNKNTFEDKKRKLLSALNSAQKKNEKRLAQIEEKLLECNSADTIKLKGELITANIYAIQRGQTSFEAVNYYDENCGTIKIELDRQLTPSQNAQKYYKKYAKLKRTQENLTQQKTEIEDKYDYLKSIEGNIYAAEELCDLIDTQTELTELGLIKKPETKGKKKKGKEVITPYRQYIIDGFKVIAGRNNAQNDRLLKGLSPEDMWLHTQKFHSSHVGIISDGRQIPDDVLLAAAQICAYYSEARERDKVSVDYCLKRYVKKPSKANLGFAVYTDYKTIIVSPDAHTGYREKE